MHLKQFFLILGLGLVGCTSGGTFPAEWEKSPPQTHDAGTTGSDASSTNTPKADAQSQTNTSPCPTITIYQDVDGDKYGNSATAIKHCADQPHADDWTTKGGDCDDSNPLTHPNAGEACNHGDDDCDGLIDEEMTTAYSSGGETTYKHHGPEYCEKFFKDQAAKGPDTDWDGFGANIDCNDNNPNIHPGVVEICNDIDDDCDGKTDEGCPPAGAVSPKGICKGSVLFVPYNCATIQAAVDAAEKHPTCSIGFKVYTTNIFVQPGVYKEGILVQGNRHVKIQRSADSGQVTINGGLEHAFQINECSTLALQDLTIKNEQNAGNKTWPSTVFVNLGGSIDIDHCEIHTQSFGVTTGYASWTWVTNSVIIGDTIEFETVGLDLNFENYPTKELGPHILNNTFQHLTIGIQSCMASPAALSETGSADSNDYEDVTITTKNGKWSSCID